MKSRAKFPLRREVCPEGLTQEVIPSTGLQSLSSLCLEVAVICTLNPSMGFCFFHLVATSSAEGQSETPSAKSCEQQHGCNAARHHDKILAHKVSVNR